MDILAAAIFLAATGLTQVAIAGRFVTSQTLNGFLQLLAGIPLQAWPLRTIERILLQALCRELQRRQA